MTINRTLLASLFQEQMAHVHALTAESRLPWRSDDGFDYLQTALGIGRDLALLTVRGDVEGLRQLLDPAAETFLCARYSGCPAGVCSAIWDALPDHWEETYEAAEERRQEEQP